MYTIQEIIDLDNHLLQTVSGGGSAFFDGCINAYVTPYLWLPLALVLLYVLLKNNSFKNFSVILLLMVAMLGISYLLTIFLLQPLSDYLRSIYNTEALNLLDALNFYRAKNGSLLILATMVSSLGIFLMLLIRHAAFNVSLALWAAIGCFAGVYTAANYPWDIVVGILLGLLCGTVAYKIFGNYMSRQRVRRDWVSNRYTKSGYEVSDIYLLLVFMYATFAATPLVSFFITLH